MSKFEGGDNSKNANQGPAESNSLSVEAFSKPSKPDEKVTQKAETPKTLDLSASTEAADKAADANEATEDNEKIENYKQKEIDNQKAIAAVPANATANITQKITALSTPEGRSVVRDGVLTAYNDMPELARMAAHMTHPGNPNPPIDPIAAQANASWANHTKTIEAIV
jgi:hypothetical protein